MKLRLLLSLFLITLLSCKESQEYKPTIVQAGVESNSNTNSILPDQFNDYWYQGKAEISRYTLSQNRYGDNHPGEAILIFVTEDFLTDKQVKSDRSKNNTSISVMKNNMIRKFTTGIYDYSMMSSIFTPIQINDHPNTLKVTTSSQDWCGQTFQQINWKKNKYVSELRSYFESEGDYTKELENTLLEDEIFNRIRINPNALPIGNINIIPSSQISRLMHLELNVYKANAQMNNYEGDEFSGELLKSYKLTFPKLDRNLEIIFENEFPYKIIGWKDSYPSMFDKSIRTTVAQKTHERYSVYWQENSPNDIDLRKELGL